MSNPGRIVLSLLLLILPLFAGVVAKVDENPVIAGERVELEIEATGERVEFPKIGRVGGSEVTTEGSRRLEWFDANRSVVKWVQIYTFTPKKSVTIPSYTVVVDGKEERTKPIFLQVKPDARQRKNDFRIELKTDRQTAYVGEPVEVTIRFKERRDVPVMSVDFVPLKYEDFWVKRVGKPRRYSEGEYLVHEIRYLFFPQKAGTLRIGPAQVKVAMAKKMRDAFGFIVRRPQWTTLTSEPLTLSVKPLPEGVTLVGDFSLDTEISSRQVESGSPVTLTLRVKAKGNIEDFEPPQLKIPDVTVYAEPAKITQSYSGGVYTGTWERRYVLIADSPFTIPSFRLRFFDPEKEEVKEVSSDPVRIDVIGGEEAAKETPLPEAEKRIQRRDEGTLLSLIAAFAAGMGTAALLSWAIGRVRRRRREPHERPKGELQMLQALMPYISESKEAAQMAENLYANLFEGRAVRIDRKMFEKLLERVRRS
ncbi:BatD family protein [Hydrogenimonas sp.]